MKQQERWRCLKEVVDTSRIETGICYYLVKGRMAYEQLCEGWVNWISRRGVRKQTETDHGEGADGCPPIFKGGRTPDNPTANKSQFCNCRNRARQGKRRHYEKYSNIRLFYYKRFREMIATEREVLVGEIKRLKRKMRKILKQRAALQERMRATRAAMHPIIQHLMQAILTAEEAEEEAAAALAQLAIARQSRLLAAPLPLGEAGPSHSGYDPGDDPGADP